MSNLPKIHPRHGAVVDASLALSDAMRGYKLTACEELMILSARLAELTRGYVQEERQPTTEEPGR
jgi:hypothetical protein